MRLKLKNFLCWTNQEFDIPYTNGLVLISGMSGRGKSSILKAVLFCLFDQGKKLCSHGTTSMSVEMWIDLPNELTLHITRSKKPNRLLVEYSRDDQIHKYEDDTAQKIIDTQFGKHFKTCSYIQQKGHKSFFSMSPAEKLTFLEDMIFENIDLTSVKKKLSIEIKQLNDSYVSYDSQYKLSHDVFSELKEPTVVEFPLKGNTIESKRKSLENEKTRLNNSLIKEKKHQKKYEKITRDIQEKEKFDLLSTQILKSITEYEIEIENKKKEIQSFTQQDIQTVEQYETEKEIIESSAEYDNLKEELTRLQQEYQSNLTTERFRIESEIQKVSNEIIETHSPGELSKKIDGMKKQIKINEDYKVLEKKKGEYNQDNLDQMFNKKLGLETEITSVHLKIKHLTLQSEIRYCPHCNKTLKISKGTDIIPYDLEIMTDAQTIPQLNSMVKIKEKELEAVKKNIKTLEDRKAEYMLCDQMLCKLVIQPVDINEIKQLQVFMDTYTRCVNSKKMLETQLSNIEKNSIFSKLNQKIKSIQTQISEIEEIGLDSSDFTLNEIIELLNKAKHRDTMVKNLNQTLENLNTKLNKKRDELNAMNSFGNLPELEQEKLNIESELNDIKQNIILYRKNIEQSHEYMKYYEDKSNYEKWKSKSESFRTMLEQVEQEYTAAKILREKINEAESLAISNMITEINTHFQSYIDIFFYEDPMIVDLSPYKQVKKTDSKKSQVSLNITYKGMDIELSSLSGGERDRLEMAFVLALSDISHSPLIMLDESISSLDQDTSDRILRKMSYQLNQGHKLIICVAHQVTSGIFEHVLNI